MSRTDKHLRLCVAALTRRRPEMLKALLVSWAKMPIPENCTVRFLIVENDTQNIAEPIIEAHRHLFRTSELSYAQERELGIPFGRNRAAKEAIEDGADLLLFVDDDEETAKDWLIRMIDGYRRSSAVLMGAPLRARPPAGHLSYIQKRMFENIEARYKQKEDRARQRTTLDSTDRVTIVTNNWLAELSVFKDRGIWFDENMRFTGGTDSKLCAEVKAAGLATGWITDAFVYETIPPERLTFGYQYRRARDQSNTHIRRKSQTIGRAPLIALAPVPLKTIFVLVQLVAIPFTGGRTMLTAARTLGWISGRLGFVFGIRSSLYAEVTGN